MTQTEIGPRQILRLSEKERQYLESGEVPGTYSQQHIEDCLEEKARLLPRRIEFLLEDVELLNNAHPGEISFQSWRDCWFELIGLDPNASEAEIDQAYSYTYSEGASYPSSKLVEFGENLGQLADNLYLLHTNDSLEDELVQIILGFIYGFYPLVSGDPTPLRSGDHRREALNQVTNALTDRAEILAEIEDEGEEKVREFRDETEKNTQRAKARIETILNESGVDPTPDSLSIIEKFKDRTGRVSGRRGGLLDGPFVPRLGEIGPDVSVDKTFTEETVLAIVEEERLREKIIVHRTVQDDFAELHGTRWRGPEATDILACMYQAEVDTLSSAQINERLESEKDYRNFISKLAYDMSGRESPWDRRPLVQDLDSGWSLTKYGEVIGEAIVNSHSVVGASTPRPGAPSEERIEYALPELQHVIRNFDQL